jgi:hypothetical protein
LSSAASSGGGQPVLHPFCRPPILDKGVLSNSARAANELALTLHRLARHDEAGTFYRKALSICETVLGADHREPAETCLHKAVATSEKSLGKSHPKTQKAAGDLEDFLSEKAARGG